MEAEAESLSGEQKITTLSGDTGILRIKKPFYLRAIASKIFRGLNDGLHTDIAYRVCKNCGGDVIMLPDERRILKGCPYCLSEY